MFRSDLGLSRMFQVLDANHDGVLTAAESAAVGPSSGMNPFQMMFDVVDANSDGLIDRNTELVPMIVDVVNMYLGIVDQVRDWCECCVVAGAISDVMYFWVEGC